MKDEREERMKPDRHKIMQTIEIQTNESECQVLRKGRLSEGFWCEDNLGEQPNTLGEAVAKLEKGIQSQNLTENSPNRVITLQNNDSAPK